MWKDVDKISNTTLKQICIHKSTTNSYHGYKPELLEQELDNFLSAMLMCTECDGLLREPCLTDTGYKCQFCLHKDIGKFDEIKMKAIHKLNCRCALKEKGCEWNGTISELINHSDTCAFMEVACCYKEFGCEIKRKRQDMKIHENDSNVKHIKLVSEHISTMKEEVKIMQEKFIEIEQKTKRGHEVEWRVNGVREKLKNNSTELSKYFYFGFYKFQASMNFKDSKKDALRVFIHVCKGEFDKVIVWPFDGIITLTLVSSKSAKRSISAQIKTAEYKEDFSRQLVGKSKGQGFRMAEEENLLKDEYSGSDEIVIRIFVEIYTSKLTQI
ncbi:TNF receptor-associated factor 4-like isoform X1 [Oopsacas minuta]|uniref:TNF receptor-associated factor 4-like isoform X1 n=1 Tax=Oopsacas minuta TaxID=111878 RepID=A0AAV7JZM7_9METZ|nr:TNF receptor-associated factor 4-like isoform X1 [Oopsacas minuta]